MIDVILVTPTHGRPLCLSLLEKWINQQQFSGDLEWIVAESSEAATPVGCDEHIHRPTQPGVKSFRSNVTAIVEALSRKQWHYCLVVEDDAYYSPTYVHRMFERARKSKAMLFGEDNTWDYDVRTGRSRQNKHNKHASFCNTGFHRAYLPTFKQLVDSFDWRSARLDGYIWRSTKGRKKVWKNENLMVNMKNMPGESGFVGHHPNKSQPDPDMESLRRLCGNDWTVYRDMIQWRNASA